MENFSSRPEYKRMIEVLRSKLANVDNCTNLIDSYEQVLRSIWDFTSRLLGGAGSRAVLNRAIQLAARKAPLVKTVRVDDHGVDFAEFRNHVASEGCGAADVADAFFHLGVTIFQTLSDLAGEALTQPLLKKLEEE